MVNIKQLIKDKGISQVELSRLLNEHTSVVSLLVNGKRELTETHLARLAEIFGEEVISQYDGLTDYEVAEKDVMVNIKGIITDFNLTQTDIAKIMGEPQSVVSTLANGKRKQTRQHIDALIAHFGQEVIDKYILPADAYEPKVREATDTIIDAEIIEEAKELGREEVRQKIKEKIEDVESFLIVPEAVNAEPNANIEEVIEEDGTELEAISPNLLLSDMKVSVAEQIKGTSMLPTFQPNDWVFIRFLKDTMKIVSGKTYYLKCRNRPTMIRRVKFEGEDKLRLIAKNSEYDDIIICRSDIINIGNVVALFRMTFGDQYSELEELRREKEAEREKKDSQIDKMLEMMDKQAEQQNKLIDFITKDK